MSLCTYGCVCLSLSAPLFCLLPLSFYLPSLCVSVCVYVCVFLRQICTFCHTHSHTHALTHTHIPTFFRFFSPFCAFPFFFPFPLVFFGGMQGEEEARTKTEAK